MVQITHSLVNTQYPGTVFRSADGAMLLHKALFCASPVLTKVAVGQVLVPRYRVRGVRPPFRLPARRCPDTRLGSPGLTRYGASRGPRKSGGVVGHTYGQ